MAYGSPNSLDEVGDYLAQVRGGRVSTPEEIEHLVEKISIDNPPILVGLALAPHYSKLSIDGYEDSVRRGLARKSSNIHLVMVKSWHKEPSLITGLSSRVSS